MKIIRERNEVIGYLTRAGASERPLLCPNAETPDEMEGIFLGAQRFGETRDLEEVVVGVGITGTYPDHPQLGRLIVDTPHDGEALAIAARIWFGWLNAYGGQKRLFDRVRVIPFLDHGWAPSLPDSELMESIWFQQEMGIIMFDASLNDIHSNTRLTAEYVIKTAGRVVVEACPDKVYQRSQIMEKNITEMLSDPDSVARFVVSTGVDLVVPNLGTEHRAATSGSVEYRSDLAQAITQEIGPRLALHGTSSLGNRLSTLGKDGICKVNFYTAMARAASQCIRSEWMQTPINEPLPISQACGSSLFKRRREVFAEKTCAMLAILAGESMEV